MQRTRKRVHVQPDNPEADYMPCRVTIVSTAATPAQQQAWRQLWTRLLGELTPEAAGLDPHVSPAFACPECCLPATSCNFDEEG